MRTRDMLVTCFFALFCLARAIHCQEVEKPGKKTVADKSNREEPAAAKAPPIDFEPPGIIPLVDWPADRITPRISIREDIGDGVGYTRGFTNFEGFLPVYQSPGHSILFVDGRAVNFNYPDRWEWNAGLGFRWLDPRTDWVFGVNTFFDWRESNRWSYRQIGVGLEASGPILDLRGNLYFPVGNQRTFLPGEGVLIPHFVGRNILLENARVYDNAMRGFDVEAGVPVPYLQRLGMRAYGGYYHYENTDAPSIDGGRARLEAQVNDYVTGHLAIQHDLIFRTTIHGGFALHWGGKRPYAVRSASDRLAQRVVRDPNIVVARSSESEIALDPATGKPIVVQHFNSNALPSGDGTVERPYDAMGNIHLFTNPGEILFVHNGSNFPQSFLRLSDNQRLLGEGIPHLVGSRQGVFALPRATGGNLIVLPRVGTVLLRNNNEVSGLTFIGGGGVMSSGGMISDFNINRNYFYRTTTFAGADPSVVINAQGNGILSNNAFASFVGNPDQAGFIITGNGTPGPFGGLRVLVNNNFSANNTAFRGKIVNALAQIQGNQFNVASPLKLDLHVQATGTLSSAVQLLNNTSIQGYRLENLGTGKFFVEDTRSTNIGPFIETGAITTVPVGTLGFGRP